MLRSLFITCATVALAASANRAGAFTLNGPPEAWQTTVLNYQLGDIGAPKNLGEEYRWNIPTITVGIDPSFLDYFGQRGVQEIEKAVNIINSVRNLGKLSANLAEYPTDSRRINSRASALFLLDVKSIALAFLLEELGLSSPERYTWTLRERFVYTTPPVTNYSVIMRNFDPITLAPSKYVNDTLYTYVVFDPATTFPSSDAVEIPVDPLSPAFTAVVSAADGFWGGQLGAGEFFTGLTRDDVGGLRYIYSKTNYNTESLIPGTVAGSGSPYQAVDATATNAVDVALRPGVAKLLMKFAGNDSIFGNFIILTNSYKDYFVTNSSLRKQGTQRVLVVPDIIFAAEDLGTINEVPILLRRTANWVNNDVLNGQGTLGGPGQINPQVAIVFGKVGPFIINQSSNPFFMTEEGGARSVVWGSFDGTTNAPVVYPNGTSIAELENQVLNP